MAFVFGETQGETAILVQVPWTSKRGLEVGKLHLDFELQYSNGNNI